MRKLFGHPLFQGFALLFVVLAVFFVLQAVLAVALQIGSENLTPALGLLLGLPGVVAALVTVPLARRMEGESLAGLGFPATNAVRHLVSGVAVGAGVQASVFGIMAMAGWYTVSAVTLDVGSLVTMTVLALFVHDAARHHRGGRARARRRLSADRFVVAAHRHPHRLEPGPELGVRGGIDRRRRPIRRTMLLRPGPGYRLREVERSAFRAARSWAARVWASDTSPVTGTTTSR
ncbi:hypothetical protein OHA25_59595 [Nonomuraea sp. NBC_00507]